MKRETLLLIMLALMLLSTSVLAFEARQTKPITATGKTWYVGPPPSDFAGIQEAIDSTSVLDGDIVEVKWKATPYSENVTVYKSLTIKQYSFDPAGYYPTVDGGNEKGVVFNVTVAGVEVDGFIVRNGKYGIYLAPTSSGSRIVNNTVNSSVHGIYIASSTNNTLEKNKMTGNTWNFGVGGNAINHFIQNINSSNLVDEKPVYYWLNQHDGTIPAGAGYVALINSTNIRVEKLALRNNWQGVLVEYSTNITIQKLASLENNHDGVLVEYSTGILIRDVKIVAPYGNANGGIRFVNVTCSTVQNVTVQSTTPDEFSVPIQLQSSENNIIMNNNLLTKYLSSVGIALSDSDCNIIMDNLITNTTCDTGHQISIVLENSNSNVIVGNTISTNSKYDWHYSICFYHSNETKIYRNNFLSKQIECWNISSIKTKWDNGWEGNHWSDYKGEDDGSGGRILGDGIGDTLIPHHGVDYYPLMECWSAWRTFSRQIKLAGGVKTAYIQELYTYSNSTLASFTFSGTLKQISLKVTCGYTESLNITIPRNWLDGPFKVWLNETQVGYDALTVNGTHSSIYITYEKGTSTLKIIGTELGNFTGDVNGDGKVDIYDVVWVTANYGAQEQP